MEPEADAVYCDGVYDKTGLYQSLKNINDH